MVLLLSILRLYEDAGLLKMDFLGLKNLTMIDHIIKDIEKNYNIKININEIDFNDQKTYQMISRGGNIWDFPIRVIRNEKFAC